MYTNPRSTSARLISGLPAGYAIEPSASSRAANSLTIERRKNKNLARGGTTESLQDQSRQASGSSLKSWRSPVTDEQEAPVSVMWKEHGVNERSLKVVLIRLNVRVNVSPAAGGTQLIAGSHQTSPHDSSMSGRIFPVAVTSSDRLFDPSAPLPLLPGDVTFPLG
ncbi:hypothetical protein EYF80_036113 [Liparis tanakae]|uniref:Uncharacterized protein n=1 Tax=Liparis tanakae TaxID=230148 RepID=A0A4Z2GJM5_9TELE|nr:hypothetical protein EYF80_036113 [Liparis tanakae]